MKYQWTASELLDALDVLAYNRAVEDASHRAAKAKKASI